MGPLMLRLCRPWLVLSGLLAAALAILPHVGELAGPFQLDDYGEIPAARARLRLDAAPAPEQDAAVPKEAGAAPAVPRHHLFRPLLWLVWAIVQGHAGWPWSPVPFRLVTLGVHLVALLLVVLIHRQSLGLPAALFSGILFALMSAGSEAVTWIAAGGDVLAAAAVLGSALVLLRPGGVGRSALAGALLGAALLAKESAAVLLPVAALAVLVRSGAPRARAVRLLALLLLPAIVLRLRAWALGGSLFPYSGGREADIESWFWGLERIPEAFLDLAGPKAHASELEGGAVGQLLLWVPAELRIGAVVASLGLASLSAAGRWCLLALAASLLPAALAAPGGPGTTFPRTLYVPAALLALAAGAGVANLAGESASSRRSRLAVGLRFLLVLAAAATAAHQAGPDRAARAGAAQEIRDLGRVLEAEVPGTLLVVVGPPPHRGPGLGPFLGAAHGPPFRAERRPVIGCLDRAALPELPELRCHPGPVLVLDRRDLAACGLRLDALPRGAPHWRVDAPGRFAPDPPPPVRGVAGLGLRLPPGPAALLLVHATGTGGFRATWSGRVPAREAALELGLAAPEEPEWVLGGRLESVRIEHGPKADIPAPWILEGAPRLQVRVSPSPKLLGIQDWPSYEVALPPGAGALRALVDLEMDGTWTRIAVVEPAGPEVSGAVRRWVPGPLDRWACAFAPELDFAGLGDFASRHLLDPRVKTLVWRVRLEALLEAGDGALARSPPLLHATPAR
jgi:hypothetical protein